MEYDNGKAKYYVLMEQLKEEILSGKLQAGQKLPWSVITIRLR